MNPPTLNRPARRQVAKPTGPKRTMDELPSADYNIWYGRYAGEKRKRQALEKAATRCVIARDSGKTKAGKKGLFCLHFARGCCDRGADCQYLHRLPDANDAVGNPSTDCFGRERFRDEREDMGGVGSFEKDNRTLYIGNIHSQWKDMEAIVRKHFEEWGEIEHINVLQFKGVAFVRYTHRPNAEFAKEAMYGQSLDDTQAAKKRAIDATITQAVVSNLPQIGPHGNILDYENYDYAQAAQSGDASFGYTYSDSQTSGDAAYGYHYPQTEITDAQQAQQAQQSYAYQYGADYSYYYGDGQQQYANAEAWNGYTPDQYHQYYGGAVAGTEGTDAEKTGTGPEQPAVEPASAASSTGLVSAETLQYVAAVGKGKMAQNTGQKQPPSTSVGKGKKVESTSTNGKGADKTDALALLASGYGSEGDES
ncbi:Pre-mRNA-splicing factor [Borealophlyctis nickersoniae]|nr:Pre-mRNA-splicing factor [Borealophlyctis nickersoniae]